MVIMETPAFNPYAPPTSFNPTAAMVADCYRRGKYLVVPRGSATYVPCDCCVKCGEPATKQLRRTLYWHHPVLYVLLFAALLVYLLAAIVMRKQMELTVGLCDRHRAVRRRWILAAWLTFFMGAAAFILPPTAQWPHSVDWLISGAALVFLSLVIACFASNYIIRPRVITKKEGTFVGPGEGYLSQFPGM
jgi:hypothetical protein